MILYAGGPAVMVLPAERPPHAELKSIGLQALIRAHGEGIGYGELAAQINQLRPSPRPEATAESGDIEN